MTDTTVAQTILMQLGGRKFLAMTGASHLVGSTDSLAFELPSGFATNKANICRVTLNGLDLYDMEFCRLRAGKVTLVSRDSNIYAEDLQRMFTAATGLDTHL